jgi:hypothetical protein
MRWSRSAFIFLVSAALAASCSRSPEIDTVPVGTEVQVTREDGGVVEGKLASKDEETVTITTPRRLKEVPREDVAHVAVVEPGKEPELPRIAKFREYLVEPTTLHLTLDTPVNSETSKVGEAVHARLSRPIVVDEVEVVPAGSVVHGEITHVNPSGKVKGRASLGMRFTELEAYGDKYDMSAGWFAEAQSTKGKDAAKIGIGAGAGAIIGGIIGGKKGALAGAAIGGGAGTAVVLTTEGKPIAVGKGAAVNAKLADPIEIRVPLKSNGTPE